MQPDSRQYHQKRILVLGLGLSGRAAARLLLAKGASVTGIDSCQKIVTSHPEVLELINLGLLVHHDSQFSETRQYECVVASPGISPSYPIYREALLSGVPVIGEVELASYFIKQKCLAVTGTNGKTTVTLMVAHVLNQSGIAARAVGNVGTPLSDAVDPLNEDEVLVVELSSFQLESLKNQFIDAGVILNITPDHLDRYQTMELYAAAKISIQTNLKRSGQLFVEEKCHKAFLPLFHPSAPMIYGYSSACHIHTDLQRVFHQNMESFFLPESLRRKTSHDVENLMAAYALCHHVGVTGNQFYEAIGSFKRPSHRIEFVKTVSGVHFFDDSKGTNIDAVIRAVDFLEGEIILIAGGVDKGSPYTAWINTVTKKVKHICAIGNAKDKIKEDLGNFIPVELFNTLDEAVSRASSVSQKGDIVLLSPGCSSYDMFKDYIHRGEEFQRLVNMLPSHPSSLK